MSNRPTVTTNDISFGPAVVYIGETGSTPDTAFGSVDEDGVSVAITQEHGEVRQGGPSLLELDYVMKQDVEITLKGLEWDFDTLQRALGTASTSSDGSGTYLKFGGDATPDRLAIKIVHKMPQSGNTLEFYCWTCVPSGGLQFDFTQAHHKIDFKFKCLRSSTNWASVSLGEGEELIKVARLTA